MPTLDPVTAADGRAPGTGDTHAVVAGGRPAYVSGVVIPDDPA